MRLSSATVGFVGGLSAETVGALLPSPPLCRWVVVVLRPRGSKWLSVDHSACSWLCLLVDWSGYHLWLCLLVDRSGFRRGGFRRIGVVGFSFGLLDFRVAVGLFCGGCGFVLFYCMRYIILL